MKILPGRQVPSYEEAALIAFREAGVAHMAPRGCMAGPRMSGMPFGWPGWPPQVGVQRAVALLLG